MNSATKKIIRQVSMTNSGDTNSSAILRDLSVVARVGGQYPKPGDMKFEETRSNFGKVWREQAQFKFELSSSAQPIVVKGNSAESEMVMFAPRARDCDKAPQEQRALCERGDYVSDVSFLNSLEPGKLIDLTFTGHIVGSKRKVRSECIISITDDMFRFMSVYDWYSARCAPPSTKLSNRHLGAA